MLKANLYKVLLETKAENDLDSLELSVRKRVIAKLLELQDNPRRNAKKITDSKNVWRIRAGDWRVIYEIYDKIRTVKVYRIKHRSKVYL